MEIFDLDGHNLASSRSTPVTYFLDVLKKALKEGTVFDIQRFSVHDGPGIRTLVFLKGCSLKCEWCANPESQAVTPELLFDPARCIACENCLMLCTHSALHKQGDRIVFEKERCIGCGTCAEKCYAEARVLKGRKMTVEEVVAEVLKDEAFYADSGGGVTLSGGEPLEQPGFSECILKTCRNLALHRAVEMEMILCLPGRL